MLYFWSDTHFQHDKDFIYKKRGYRNIQEHDMAIFSKMLETVTPEDDLYLLGDICLGDSTSGIRKLESIPCNVHIILGNHDTDNRVALYNNCKNVVEICYSTIVKYKKWRFYVSHYPTVVTNFDYDTKPFSRRLWNLHGHTHSFDKFEYLQYGGYNVAIEAQPQGPVDIETIISQILTFANKY